MRYFWENKIFFLIIIIFFGIIFLFPKPLYASDSIFPEVKIFDSDLVKQETSFYGFDQAFRGGVRVATGDINRDNVVEIIVAAGIGGGPNVQIFRADATKLKSFMAYDINFRNGISIASCDVNNDGYDEVITGPGSSSGPNVKIFKGDGTQLISFMAYDQDFRGGVNVACGDINGDGKDEIITGAGPGGKSHVRIFNELGTYLGLNFWPFDKSFEGGVSVAVADVDGDSTKEILMGVNKFGKSLVKIYEANSEKTILGEFTAFPDTFLGGVNLTGLDIDSDGRDEILAAANSGGGPQVRSFEINGEASRVNFFPYPEDFRGGVFIAVGDVNQEGIKEIITGPGFLNRTNSENYYKYIEIDISEQKLEYFENGFKKGEYRVSTGKTTMPTPLGTFKIKNKSPVAYSKKYGLYMPYWNQFTSQGHGLHGLPFWALKGGGRYYEGLNHLGVRVSHGCVRLSIQDAETIYNWAPVGTPIIIHS